MINRLVGVVASQARWCGVLLFAALLCTIPSAGAAQDGPSLVVLVRHAERAAEPADDPPLTEFGRARAAALAAAVAHAPPSAIIVSSRKRTMETAAPTATKFGVTPTVVALEGGTAAHIAAVAEAVRKQRGVVLVVGHSNTIPAIVKALGGPVLPDICDATFTLLYSLVPARDGRAAQLVMSQYGAVDLAPVSATATACAGMK